MEDLFTAMQERAGLEVKYLAYTSLNALKSAISAKKQVVLTTFGEVRTSFSQYSINVFAYLFSLLYDTAFNNGTSCRD